MWSRRRKRWIGIGAGLAILGLLLILVLVPRQQGEWQKMTNRIDELRAEAKAPKVTRSVLNGETIPGNAWTEYNLALREIEGLDAADTRVLEQFVNGGGKLKRDQAESVIARRREALEHLRLGARRPEGRFPHHQDRPSATEAPRKAGALSLLAAAQAKLWIESGRSQDAADVLLDVMALARDVATDAPFWADQNGMSVYLQALDQLPGLLEPAKLPRQQLAELERKLDTVARDFPSVDSALSGETLAANVFLVDKGPDNSFFELRHEIDLAATSAIQWWDLAREGSWRYAFSDKRMALDVFHQRQALLGRAEVFDQMDYTSARKESEALTAKATTSKNPLMRRSPPSFSKILVSHRNVLARLAVVRAAVSFRASGDLPTLKDPFGENLLHRQVQGKTKIWSVGSNGRDDGGVGVWPSTAAWPDIVLELSATE